MGMGHLSLTQTNDAWVVNRLTNGVLNNINSHHSHIRREGRGGNRGERGDGTVIKYASPQGKHPLLRSLQALHSGPPGVFIYLSH